MIGVVKRYARISDFMTRVTGHNYNLRIGGLHDVEGGHAMVRSVANNQLLRAIGRSSSAKNLANDSNRLVDAQSPFTSGTLLANYGSLMTY